MSPSGATATSTPAKAQGKSAAPRRKRGEGQWALGYREPLNKNEENKKFDNGLNVRQRIIDIYAKQGFDSIDPADLRGRFRWYGLYTQRRPGIDGGKTAILEPEELDDRYFMLRVRIDGGQLSAAQLRVISDISVKYARGTADVTDRQNIQLHWIEIESVPAIWEALEGVGLSTTEACGDTPRVILGCPLAGLDSDELIDATPEIAAIAEQYIGDPELSNLPRKFKSSISGCAAQCTHHEINDIAFAAVRHPETGEIGYDLWVGGGLSTNPMIAKRLGAFVRAGQVPEVWKAPRADQVPDRRLGRGEVPRDPGEGVSRLRAARRSRPRERGQLHAGPRRRPPAAGRPLLCRVRAARRAAGRRAPRLDRRAGRTLRHRPGTDHRRAEDGHPGRA
jgi:sulfite reductase (ferredoxin)